MIRLAGKYAFFYTEWPSNFYQTKFIWHAFGEKHKFFCTEQAFMWAKAKYFNDTEIADRILVANTPMDCKQLGRIVKGYDDKAWDLVRYGFMHDANYEKYKQDLKLRAKLVDHKFDEKMFVEASPTDRIWGLDEQLKIQQLKMNLNGVGKIYLEKSLLKYVLRLFMTLGQMHK